MKIATGTVVDGRIEFEGKPFADGETVTVLGDDEGGFDVTPEEKAFLLESLAQAKRGEVEDMESLLDELDAET